MVTGMKASVKKFDLLSHYNLPQISELTKKFDIDSKEFEDIDELRLEMSDSLFDMAEKIIEPVVVGENFCCMFEQQMLTTDDMNKMLSLYKRIQSLKWENNMLSIKSDDKKVIRCINKMWTLYNELEVELKDICKKLSIQWENFDLQAEAPEEESKSSYHG